MTSMPTSRARTAICSAPFEWPSRPGLPTRIRIGCPISSETLETRSRTSPSRSPLTEPPARCLRDAGGRAVVAEDLAQDAGPLAGGGAGLGGLDGRRQDVRALVAGGLGELLERRVDGALIALRAPLLEGGDPLALDLGVGGEDAAVLAGGERRVLGLGELVLADDDDVAALDLRDPLAVRLDQPGLHVGDRLDRAALLLDRLHLGLGALDELGDQARPSPSSPRRCRGTRAGPSRWPGSAGCAGSTAGPRGGAGRAPRSRPAAGSRGRGRRGRASRQAPRARSGARCSRAGTRSGRAS